MAKRGGVQDPAPIDGTKAVADTSAATGFIDGKDPRYDARPDTRYISTLIRQARFEFNRRDMADYLREAVYWQEQEIPHPSHIDVEVVHTGIPTETVQRLMGIFGDRPTVLVGELDVDDLKERQALQVQDFLNGIFPALEIDSRKDTWDNIIEDVLRLGRGYDKLEFVPERRSMKNPHFPRRGMILDTKRGEDGSYQFTDIEEDADSYLRRQRDFNVYERLPMLWRHLPAQGCYAWYDDEGISEFLQVEQRRIRDIMRRYPHVPMLNQVQSVGISSVSYVIMAEYWNRSWCGRWVSQGFGAQQFENRIWESATLLNRITSLDLAEVVPNIYGVVPVVETPGLISTNRDPARRHMSVIDVMIPICTYLDQLVSQHGSAVRMWAWPTPALKNLGVNGTVLAQQPIGPDGRPIPIEIEPGKMLTLLPGEDITWVIAPNNGADANTLIEYVEKRANALGISSAVFDATALQSNGYLYNSVVNALRSKYSQVPRHVKRSHQDRCNLALRIMEMYGDELFVRRPGDGETEVGTWFKLNGAAIKGHHYSIDVKYQDRLPTDQQSRIAMAVQAITPVGDAGPLLDHDTARSIFMDIPDPTRIGQKILIQRYKYTVAMNFLMVKAAKDAGTILDQRQQMNPDEVEGLELPPGLSAALNGGGGTSASGAGASAGPVTAGGVSGAPAAANNAGTEQAVNPPQPMGMGMKPAPAGRGNGVGGAGGAAPRGRAPGQSRRPPTQRPPRPGF